MDYSELVEALQNGDDVRVNEMLKEIIPRLVRFLQIHMGASKSDAEDSVQQAMEPGLDAIREHSLDSNDAVLSYLISTCKNTYLKFMEKKREVNYDRVPSSEFHLPNQMESILDKERKRILKRCMEELQEMYRKFMQYWFDHPDCQAEAVAAEFNLSVSNVWTRKHRIIKKLNRCYKKKSNK
ncbi:RNA polymerase sigma factor [Aliifodinibius sp. S!AR15-10]|uniref:RNA polymerase sigma factor n=1 Tax=Aliifodinibius sp. S!AR15-10 TaxID=2950437 RepID=UPI0028674745|nr:RNA polymerase sigma factor [Aliifodinibius sp. S!AR15-10]MDR8391356.1 RNA polymerase sigma factor [Aliifodinibius sp. S!AR15-10]